MKETLRLFGEDRSGPDADSELMAKRCPECGHQFSGEARFCPFDGGLLALEGVWDRSGDPLLGQLIDGRYQVESVLGEGGMGTVYRVRHASLDRPFALKVLRQDLAGDSELAVRFIQEAKAAASVSHPNVVQITDFGRLASGQPYFIMEMLAGESLGWLIQHGGAIPSARAVRILRQVAEALGAAHAQGIVHRDLKPDNIHVGEAAGTTLDVVKVLDFGLAKVAGASRLTRQGIVFGTPHYMSPEQASGGVVDHRADMYALGVVMYEMFTGHVPFEADSYMGVLTKHMFVAPTPPSELISGGRELGALEDMTLRCLLKKPAQRFQSMAEFVEELDRVASVRDDGSLSLSPSEGGARPLHNLLADELEPPSPEELKLALGRRNTPGNWTSFAVAGVGLAALLGAIAWLVLRTDPSSATPAGSQATLLVSASPPALVSASATTASVSANLDAISTPALDAAPPPSSAPPPRAPPPRAPRVIPTPAPTLSATTPPPAADAPKAIGGAEVIDPWK